MKKTISIILCVLWIGFIFYNSSNNGTKSNYRSNKVVNTIKTIYKKAKKPIEKNKTKDTNKKLESSKEYLTSNRFKNKEAYENYLVRRSAHAFEYFILAILISNAFYQFKIKGKRAFIYILFLCLFTANLDEFYQSFVPGRSSSVGDVLLDFTGSVFATFLFHIFLSIKIKDIS
ncbi:VanZ family protein [Clostridium cochlearium]|uniref:VanZ family protein n=1 Tax=Clostridium cochlearium TaxID=1494 RepID=UPI00157065AE|nr:VanZ family protein [Clostridium cochlearium]MBV1817945.1 VanZ family protein [Bacteroidales bacterium MSK.15.36]MCG4571364.1 VanZ family protein [Clostridium cochlearium]MCG4579995.1 VanZ family protein [Clostridium cochlearium]NSJ90605.1 teicoplanin resistance protein VanZ [Coprococcus sp. MSK.21.13]